MFLRPSVGGPTQEDEAEAAPKPSKRAKREASGEPASGEPTIVPGREATVRAKDDPHAWLDPDVKSPVGIPKDYRPNETSSHALLRIELTDFVGPLDLLLFLIREHDLDVLDIPIAFITQRYLAMLDTIEGLSIDIAADFLVMAAELTHIKSKMLLPPKEGIPVEAEDLMDPGDPRQDLVRRLLEYQKYREAAGTLDGARQLGRDVFARKEVVPEAMEDLEPGPGDFSIFRLMEAMADVLSKLTPEKQHEVIADTINITERIEFIHGFGEARGMRFPFVDLFAGMESRRVVVMTFLAILEMARTAMLAIEQVAVDDGAPAEEEALAPREESTRVTADDVAEAYEAAESALEEPRSRTVRKVSELERLDAPPPEEIWLVLTGKRADLARDDYAG